MIAKKPAYCSQQVLKFKRPGAQGSKQKVFSETGVRDMLGLPCGCKTSNLSPLQEQPVLLAAEPSLQPTVGSHP